MSGVNENAANTQQQSNASHRQLDIVAIIQLLWQQKILLVGVITIAALLSIWYALSQDEIYMAELRAMPSEHSLKPTDSSLQATIALRMSGFGSAVGEYEKHLVAVQVMRSRNFIHDFIARHELTPLLFGVNGWNPQSNELSWNESIYNPSTQRWVTDDPPTLQDATQSFRLNNLIINDDRQSRVLSIRVFHHSAVLAAEWAELLLSDLNQHMQEKEITELQDRLHFFQQQLAITQNQTARNSILQHIEEITYQSLLAQSSNRFLYEVVDPAMVPERRAYPRRGLLVVLGTFLGGILALALVFLRILLWPPQALLAITATSSRGSE